MRFGSRETVGLSASSVQDAIQPPSMWLPVEVDTGPLSAVSTRTITTITGGVANTKGSYSQLIASTAADANWVNVHNNLASSVSATDSSALLDIAVGAAAAEVDIIPNIPIGYNPSAGLIFSFPVSIPKGSRVATRIQGAQASKQAQIQVSLSRMPLGSARVPSQLINYGADTATSGGVVLTAPGGANTKGAWTEITAATSHALQALIVCPQAGGSTNVTAGGYLFDVGMGAGGSEVVIPYMADLMTVIGSTEGMVNHNGPQPIPCNIPRGTRLAARYQTPTIAANFMDLALIGVPK